MKAETHVERLGRFDKGHRGRDAAQFVQVGHNRIEAAQGHGFAQVDPVAGKADVGMGAQGGHVFVIFAGFFEPADLKGRKGAQGKAGGGQGVAAIGVDPQIARTYRRADFAQHRYFLGHRNGCDFAFEHCRSMSLDHRGAIARYL